MSTTIDIIVRISLSALWKVRSTMEKSLLCQENIQPSATLSISCPTIIPSSETSPKRNLSLLHLAKATVPEDVFSFLHHPASPSKWSYFFTHSRDWETDRVLGSPCEEIYLTRTGSRSSQPNKCVAVAIIPKGHESIVQQSHRVGYTALNTDQYQQDYPRDYQNPHSNENLLLVPFLKERSHLVDSFLAMMGDPIDPVTGKRRVAIVMVANEGVMDLLLNFLCSAEHIKIDISSVVVFVGDVGDISLIENMGAKAFFHPALGTV